MRPQALQHWLGRQYSRTAARVAENRTPKPPECGSAFKRFADDTGGAVAVVFGLMALVLFMAIGLAVDYARFQSARNQTLAAADSAVLAGARALQTNGGDQTAAVAMAKAYYAQATKSRIGVAADTVGFTVADSGNSIVTTGNVMMSTPFMGFGGTKKLQLLHSNGSDYAKAIIAAGQNAQTDLEVSLILDLSGSMAGQKIEDLKSSATDFVNIVMWADQSTYTSKIALVPYAVAVNAGTYADAARGAVKKTSCTITSVGCSTYQFKNTYNQTKTFNASTCVSERTGTNAYTDVSATASKVGWNYAASGNPCLTNTVVPLTNDKNTLLTSISALQASGSTGGQVGVAWGWYTLSPNWADIWPSASDPEPYANLTLLNSKGKPKLQKIAILMTDGEYNSPYCNGVISQDATTGSGDPADHINCNAPNGSAYSQSQLTCAAMKKAGIEVYTIGFLVVDSQPARDLMSSCATDASHMYISSSGDDLKAAFRDIGLKVSSLYLSQ